MQTFVFHSAVVLWTQSFQANNYMELNTSLYQYILAYTQTFHYVQSCCSSWTKLFSLQNVYLRHHSFPHILLQINTQTTLTSCLMSVVFSFMTKNNLKTPQTCQGFWLAKDLVVFGPVALIWHVWRSDNLEGCVVWPEPERLGSWKNPSEAVFAGQSSVWEIKLPMRWLCPS